jgi:hypothetical protein
MSEKPKEDSMNIYDRIREETREKQREEADRKQRFADMLDKQSGGNPLDRIKGENK